METSKKKVNRRGDRDFVDVNWEKKEKKKKKSEKK